MALAGHTTELKARPTTKINDNDKPASQLSPTASPSNDADPTLELAPLKAILVQLATGLLALIFCLF
jgi:hypothetical protein